jgi:signal transduction histidine kinase
MNLSTAPGAPLRLTKLVAITFGGFFLLGYGGMVVWGGNIHASTPIWPATAFGILMLLRQSRERRDDIVMTLAMLAAAFAASFLGGTQIALAVIYSIFNVLKVILGIALVRRMTPVRLGSRRTFWKFILAAGVAPALMAAILAASLFAATGGNYQLAAVKWFCSHLLGVCILFPFGLTVSLRQFAKLELKRRFGEALALFSAIAVTSVIAFSQAPALLFVVLVGAAAAGVRFRVMGAGAALLVISAIAFATVHTLPQAHTVAWAETLQFFLAVCSAVSVRAAMLLNERDLHVAIIERRHRRAVRASRFKSQLLAHVSHEVRSPLSAIIGFSSMLESGTLPAGRAPEFAALIGHSGELLQRLHDDLLDMSRAEAGTLSMLYERVTLHSTLKNCVDAIRLDAALGGKDVLIDTIEDTLAVKADPVRLAQILNNLIANAYKYGDNFSPIRVRASRLGDGFGRIEIVNTGPGIPAQERGAVFLPFRRSAEVGRNVPGAGLGLSIAKLLVEAQGGRIDFESDPGRQTRFWIDLPLVA